MLTDLSYSTPACTVLSVCSETVLCVSVGELNPATTESFENVNEFEW